MNARAPYRMKEQPEKIAAEPLSSEYRKIVLKCNWKFENVCESQTQWRREFATESSTRYTIACILDKFDTHGTMHDVNKQRDGRSCTASNPVSSVMPYMIMCFGHHFTQHSS
jgi:hypothetical protein